MLYTLYIHLDLKSRGWFSLYFLSAFTVVELLCLFIYPCLSTIQRHSKSRLTCQSMDKEEDGQERSGREAGGQFNR